MVSARLHEENWIVVPAVAGSSPVTLPSKPPSDSFTKRYPIVALRALSLPIQIGNYHFQDSESTLPR